LLRKGAENIQTELKHFIKETGMSVEEFAESIGFSDAYVYMIINKKRNPSWNFQQRLKEKYPDADMNNIIYGSKT
jgi:transcriptional regulator with XRE-family HTH domain